MDINFIEKAKRLHRETFVADAHYDLLNFVVSKRIEGGRSDVIASDYLGRLRLGGIDLLICSIFLDDCHVPEMSLRRALDQISCLHEEMDQCGDIALCRSTKEIKTAAQAGKIAILLSLEGVEPIGNDLYMLRIFYELGVRGVGLTWNRRNYAADGCSVVREKTGYGLTDFGVSLVKKCEKLGMYIDVSHLNDAGFQSLCEIAARPFMASHSNSRALTPVARNLTDAQILTIAENGGVIGLNSSGNFVRLTGSKRAGAHEMAVHASHIKELVGAEHICLGFDFCDEMRFNTGQALLDSINFYDHSSELTASLLEEGFSESEVTGIMGKNLMSYLERVIG